MADGVDVGDIELGPGASEAAPLTEALQTDELRESLLQPVCEGACCINTSCTLCCLAGIVTPIVCLSLTGQIDREGAEADALDIAEPGSHRRLLIAAACIGVAVGLCMACSLVWRLLLPKPATPKPMFPLSKPSRVKVPKKVYVLVNPKGGTRGSAQATYDTIVKPGLE
jgi:hypothetical protein